MHEIQWLLACMVLLSTSALQLLKPYQLGKSLQLANRVVMAPLTRSRAGVSRLANDFMRQYYEQRASAGLIIAEATAVSAQGYGWYGSPALYTAEHADAWKGVVDGVHSKGGRIFLQAWHMGRQSHSSFHDSKETVSSSAIGVPGDLRTRDAQLQPVRYETPRALRTEEIEGIVRDYGKSAALAKQAGFDGIEIHAANGYLLDCFLQSATNTRTDRYGGDIGNRVRIIQEIVEAVSESYPTDRIGIRVSPNKPNRGMGSADNHILFPYLASCMRQMDLGYMHVMDGLDLGFHDRCPAVTLHEMKKHFEGPIIGNIAFTRDTAEGAVRSGAADMVAFGRPFLSNPDLVERFTNDWPLNPPCPDEYEDGNDPDPAKCLKGYLDFPFYQPQQ